MCAIQATENMSSLAEQRAALVILEYHRIADCGPEKLRPWRTDIADFAAQMEWIAASNFKLTTPSRWYRTPGPGLSLAVTFDDAYEDFLTAAWPVLERLNVKAEVYVPTGHVGSASSWDAAHSTAPLMSWAQIRALQAGGVDFNSHCKTHRPLVRLNALEIGAELAESKDTLEQELGASIDTVAYPYGSYNETVQELAIASGYQFGVTVEAGTCLRASNRLSLPRLEVHGGTTLAQFVRNVLNLCGSTA